MKSRKQMRNIFIKKMDDILVNYYKAVDFSVFTSGEDVRPFEDIYWQEVLKVIALMRELELLTGSEYGLLRDVYADYFSFYPC
mgnify:CR=1 FL=1